MAYVSTAKGEDDFALAAGFARRDKDPRPISEIPEDEPLQGGAFTLLPADR